MSQNVFQTLYQIDSETQDLVYKNFSEIDIRPIIDAFYDQFANHEVTKPFFKGHDISELKKRQVSHWSNLIQHGLTDELLEKTEKIGSSHEKIGVTPEIYLAGYAKVLEELLDASLSKQGRFVNKGKRKQIIGGYCRILMMDMAASLSAYMKKSYGTQHATDDRQSTAQNTIEGIMDDAVTVSMSINQVFMDVLRTDQVANEVDHQVTSVSAAIEEMTATVGTINQSTSQALEYVQNTSQCAEEGGRVTQEASNMMGQIREAVTDTSDKSSKLSESSKKIEDIVTKIQDIADQTNLLALNATIEAARAGDAGKGFAVVANEVKSLSNETSKATQEISEIINEFVVNIQGIVTALAEVDSVVVKGQEVTEQVRDSMGQIQHHASDVSRLMEDVSRALIEQTEASKEISGASSRIMSVSAQNRESSQENATMCREASEKVAHLIQCIGDVNYDNEFVVLKLAKSDHIVWKRKLADMLLGNKAMDKAELKDHTQCRLGAWYYTEGKTMFGSEAAFRDVEKPHAEIHKLGREAYDLHGARQYDQALAKLNEMEDVSKEVLEGLDRLDEIAQAHRSK